MFLNIQACAFENNFKYCVQVGRLFMLCKFGKLSYIQLQLKPFFEVNEPESGIGGFCSEFCLETFTLTHLSIHDYIKTKMSSFDVQVFPLVQHFREP